MSAYPAPTNETVEILRRIEPALGLMAGRLDKIETELRRQGESIAELRGKVSQPYLLPSRPTTSRSLNLVSRSDIN